MKTISLKKVSAVAVASLGFGLLSVVPAQAAGTGTVSVGTTTPASPTAGSATSIPVTFTFGGTEVASETFILTASLQSYPNGATTTAPTWQAAADAGALTGSSFAAAATATAAGAVRTSASVATITQATTTPVNDTGGVLGNLTFTPSVPGAYVLKITGTGTGTAANAFIAVNVGGLAATQATSGVGTATATGQVSGNATFVYSVPAGAVSGTVYQISATGGTITSVNDKITATPSFTTTASDANLASGAVAYTGTTNVTKTNAIDFAAGARYTAGGTITSAVYDLDGANAAARAEQFTVTLTSGTAASVTTLTINAVTVSTGATSTVATGTVTWGSAPVVSAAFSTAKLAYGNDCTTASTVPVVLSRTAGVTLAAGVTTGASLCIETKDQNDVAINGQSLSVTISGPGLIRLDDNVTTGVTGNVRTQSLTAASRASTSTAAIGITADGTAGVATITVTAGTTVIATKTVTFYGAAAKYTATVLQNITDDGVATTDAVLVAATDSAGIPVPSSTIYAFSGSTAAATVPSSVTTVASAGTLGGTAPTSFQAATPIGSAEVNVTGVSGTTAKDVTITFGNASTIATSTVTTTAVVKIGSIKASSIKVSTDKASYAPGEAMKITFAMTDALGRPIASGAGTGLLDSVITSASLSGEALPTTAIASLTGSKTYTVFAPLSGGKVKITTTTGAAGTFVAAAGADQVIVTDVTVTDPSAALNTRIDSLNAKIVALTALIAKIMKSLKIK